jgi:hypothetical protein
VNTCPCAMLGRAKISTAADGIFRGARGRTLLVSHLPMPEVFARS